MPSYLRQWFVHRHSGTEPVRLRNGSIESKLIKLAVVKPPVSAIPTRQREDEVAICIPYSKTRDPRIYNHITDTGKRALLENVKNLTSHDRGRTFKVILDALQNELGYEVHWKVVDGQHFVPQHRERIYIVGFRSKTDFTWDDLRFPDHQPVLADILHKTDGTEPYLPWDGDKYFDFEHNKVQDKYTLTPRLWQYLQDYRKKHEALGHGFGYGLVTPDMVSRTLSARYHKDGSEILVAQEGERPRRLTPRECARLMGYPDDFRIPVSDTQAYRQFGNSVVVPAIAEVARIMRPHILKVMAEGDQGVILDDAEKSADEIQKARELAVAGAGEN